VTFRLRSGTAVDKAAIAAFTQDTFEWGDYVTREFDNWIADSAGTVVVAVDEADTAIAVATATLLSPYELWLHGVRVDPAWRRQGVASQMLEYLTGAGRKRGATVARLAVDDWNEPGIAQVTSIGMRHTSDWMATTREVVATAPVTKTNGGRRRPPADRLNRAASAEAHAAYVAWTSGELGRAARNMLAIGWRWRRLNVQDLVKAAMADALWMSPAGWVLAGVDDDTLEIGWLETTPDLAFELTKSAIDLASELGTSRIEIKVPAVSWLHTGLDALGFDVGRFRLFELPL